jgi:hypothetical protein
MAGKVAGGMCFMSSCIPKKTTNDRNQLNSAKTQGPL